MTPAETCLARIRETNPALRAFVYVDPTAQGPGLPVAVKANIAVAGLPWHGGIAAYAERIAAVDAPVVTALRASGAVILGVLNMHEAGLGGSSDNPFFGACRNPDFPGLSPGGSSGGGAAAAAAGLCAAALGTDTLGSIRIPAAYCGIFGHKPASGLLSTAGVMPLSTTLDNVGIQAASAELCLEVLQALAPITASLPRTGAVLDITGQAALDPGCAAALEATAARAKALGLAMETRHLPGLNLTALRRAGLLIAEAEAALYHCPRLAECPDGFTPELRQMLAWGAAQPASKLAAAHQLTGEAGATIRAAMAGIDVLLLPTTPQPPFAFGTAPPPDQADLTVLANIAGLAATSFPAGCDARGRPLAVQALSTQDSMALAAAAMLSSRQAGRGWPGSAPLRKFGQRAQRPGLPHAAPV